MRNDIEGEKHFIESLPYSLELTGRISNLLARNFHKNELKNSIGPDEFIILNTIIVNPGISQSEIARLTLKGKAHAGKILTAMEKKGYIKRTPVCHENSLIKKTEITEMGLERYNEMRPKILEAFQNILKPFSKDEIKIFKQLLLKYRNSLLETVDVNIK